jgi:N-acetylmuramoyl-L-alanine amidase-like protein
MIDQPGPPAEAFLHHTVDGDAAALNSEAEQSAHMRAIQRDHFDRGWSDIGYHFVLFQPFPPLRHARVFEGRDTHKVPAAQAGHNTGTLAIAVVGDFTTDTLQRNTRYAVELVLRMHPALETVGGHRDVTPTACPGDGIYRWLDRIADAAGVRRYGDTRVS